MKLDELTPKRKTLSPELIRRNEVINFEKLVKERVDTWVAQRVDSPYKILNDDINIIVKYLEKSKVFSLNRLMDALRPDISVGFLQYVIDGAKDAIKKAGFDRAGNAPKPSRTQAERIDNYLKQKWIKR